MRRPRMAIPEGRGVGSARGLVPPAVLCHCRVTGGADLGEAGSLKVKEGGC